VTQTIAQVFRDYNTDQVPGSGEHKPIKSEIRALLKQIQNSGGQAVTRDTLTALQAVTPPDENHMGIVLTGTGAGYYSRSGGEWVFGRPFPDTAAVFTQTGGSGNAIQASVAAGVDPGNTIIAVLVPTLTNGGGGVTIAAGGGAPTAILSASGAPLGAGEIVAGQAALLVRISAMWRLFPLTSSAPFAYRGPWDSGTAYVANDLVTDDGSIWFALRASTGVEPVEGMDWTLWLPGTSAADESIDAPKIQRNDRLDILAKLGIEMPQPNLVEKLLAGVSVRGMYIRPWISGGNTIGAFVGYGMAKDYNSVVEFRFLFDPDDLLLSNGAVVGVEDTAQQSIQPTLSGTFNTGSAPSSYTATLNDTVSSGSLTFCGDIYFSSPTNNNGGVWEFNLGGMITRVSTWSAGSVTERRMRIFRDVPYATYASGIVGKFIGDDPEHAPTGGTSRGWITYQAGSTTNKAFHLGNVKQPSTAADGLFSLNSVPEFAIQSRPANQPGYTARWVPEHAGVSGVASGINFKLIVDGETISSTVGDLTALAAYRECETVEIIQSFNAVNPSGGGTMWQHTISHTLKKGKPMVTVRNRMVVSQDTYVAAGYLAMFPSDTDFASRLVLNNGTVISPVPADDTTADFGFDVSGAMFAGEYSGTAGNYHAMAVQVSSLREAASLGGRTQPAVPGLLDFRANTVAKVYWRICDPATTLLAGEQFTCQYDIAVVGGVRFPNTLLAAI
jgi:hypothetical protein